MSQILVLCTGFSWFWSNSNFLLSSKLKLYARPVGLLVLLLTFHAGDRSSIPRSNTNYFWLLHWFYLINSWKMNLFFSIFCQGTKTVMLLPHTDVIIEQYPIEFCLVHWKKNIILFPLRGVIWWKYCNHPLILIKYKYQTSSCI